VVVRGPRACPGWGGENAPGWSNNVCPATPPQGQARGPHPSAAHPPVPTHKEDILHIQEVLERKTDGVPPPFS